MTGDIGQNIRDIRIALDLSTSQVAETIGLSRSYYAQLETGKRKLSADHVRRIADALGVPVGELFETSGRRSARPARRGPIQKATRTLNVRELRRRLEPLLGEHTSGAVKCIELLISSPSEMKALMKRIKGEMARQAQ